MSFCVIYLWAMIVKWFLNLWRREYWSDGWLDAKIKINGIREKWIESKIVQMKVIMRRSLIEKVIKNKIKERRASSSTESVNIFSIQVAVQKLSINSEKNLNLSSESRILWTNKSLTSTRSSRDSLTLSKARSIRTNSSEKMR